MDSLDDLVLGGVLPMAVTSKGNILLRILQYVQRSILTCTSRCLICHKPHPPETLGVKPYVCMQAPCMCEFKLLDPYINAGVDIFLELQRSPEVLDLLISLAFSCFSAGGKHFPELIPPRVEAWSREPGVGYVTADEGDASGHTVRGMDTKFVSLFTREGLTDKEDDTTIYLELANGERFEVDKVTDDLTMLVKRPFRPTAQGQGGIMEYGVARYFLFDSTVGSKTTRSSQILSMLKVLPSVAEMRACGSSAELQTMLNRLHPCAYT